MDSIKKSSHQQVGGVNINMDKAHHLNSLEDQSIRGLKEHNVTASGSSLSDSGCPQSPDDAELFSPPSLSRCVTDSPSHYFLRGTQHRWSSTPLLKVPGFQRSISMAPSVLPATIVFSPPKASSTPETNDTKGKGLASGVVSPFTTGFSDQDSPAAISSLSNIQHPSNSSNQKISSLALVSSQEFKHRLHACEDIEELDDNDTTLPFNGSSFDLHISAHQHLVKSANYSSEDNTSVKLVNNNNASRESDSGIGSSHHETSADESPKKNKIKASTAVVTKLRRSPRSLAIQNRLDRISRGTGSTKVVTSPSKGKGGRLRTTSFRKTPGFYSDWDRLDIFSYLCRLNMLHLVDTMLGYLCPADLCRVSLVSTSWNKLLQQPLFSAHEARRVDYVNFVKLNRENYGRIVEVPMTRSSSRIALKEMNRISPQNKRNWESSHSAPCVISPSKIRSRLFAEDTPSVAPEVPLIENTIKTLHCPHCSANSKIKTCQDKNGCAYEVAKCTSKSCSFVFCVKCLYMNHPGKSCQIPQITRSRSAGVTSKKSKARLRRL